MLASSRAEQPRPNFVRFGLLKILDFFVAVRQHSMKRLEKRNDTYRSTTAHVHISTPQLPPRRLCGLAYSTSCLLRSVDITMDWEVISEQTLRHIEELLPRRGPTVPSVGKPTPPRESSSGAEKQQSINTRAGGASSPTTGSSTWKGYFRYNDLSP